MLGFPYLLHLRHFETYLTSQIFDFGTDKLKFAQSWKYSRQIACTADFMRVLEC